jgi:hypothetical protein
VTHVCFCWLAAPKKDAFFYFYAFPSACAFGTYLALYIDAKCTPQQQPKTNQTAG